MTLSLKFLKDKKMPDWLFTGLMYLTFCASQWYAARNEFAWLSSYNTSVQWLANDVAAFFLAGLVPILIFGLFTRFTFAPLKNVVRGIDSSGLVYALKFFLIVANICAFLIKLFGLFYPFSNAILNIFTDFVIIALFGVWFLFFAAKYYVPKERMGVVVYRVAGSYLMLYGVVALLNILMGVLL